MIAMISGVLIALVTVFLLGHLFSQEIRERAVAVLLACGLGIFIAELGPQLFLAGFLLTLSVFLFKYIFS